MITPEELIKRLKGSALALTYFGDDLISLLEEILGSLPREGISEEVDALKADTETLKTNTEYLKIPGNEDAGELDSFEGSKEEALAAMGLSEEAFDAAFNYQGFKYAGIECLCGPLRSEGQFKLIAEGDDDYFVDPSGGTHYWTFAGHNGVINFMRTWHEEDDDTYALAYTAF